MTTGDNMNSAAIDLEDLLRRYIQHVGESEGTDFLSESDVGRYKVSRVEFTADEIAVLRRLANASRIATKQYPAD